MLEDAKVAECHVHTAKNIFVQMPFLNIVLETSGYWSEGYKNGTFYWRSKSGFCFQLAPRSLNDNSIPSRHYFFNTLNRKTLFNLTNTIIRNGGEITGEPGPRSFCYAVFAIDPAGQEFFAFTFANQ